MYWVYEESLSSDNVYFHTLQQIQRRETSGNFTWRHVSIEYNSFPLAVMLI